MQIPTNLLKSVISKKVKSPRPNEKPLRDEMLSRDGLTEQAQLLADLHKVIISSKGSKSLYSRFEENVEIIDKIYAVHCLAAKNNETLSSAAEWLLDNYYIISEQVIDIQRDFPKGYNHILPKLADGDFKNYPRVYHLALEFISHTDATVEEESLILYTNAYQLNAELTIGELWAIPIMLRFALIENLRRLASADLEIKEQREIADLLVEEIIGKDDCSSTDILLMLASKLKEHPNFLSPGALNLIRRLREKGPKSALTLEWLEERLKEQGYEAEELSRYEQHTQAANQISISSSISSLRKIGTIDWKNWFERVSLVHQQLLSDPADIYRYCDFATRDSQRKQIESLSRKSKLSELQIVNALLLYSQTGKSRTVTTNDFRFIHVGYYLLGEGFKDFSLSLKIKFNLRERFRRYSKSHAFFIYSFSIIVLSLLMIVQLINYTKISGTDWQAFIVAVFFAIPISNLSSDFIQWLVTNSIKPKLLPKLDFEEGIPVTARTVVTIQVIFQNLDFVTKTVESLEVQYLANDDPNIIFALLADLKDSTSEIAIEDQALIDLTTNLIQDLNRRHFPDQPARFFLLFRRRQWNEHERQFMGWERKRGKVTEFNYLLLGAEDTSFYFCVGHHSDLRNIKYVITLDSDSYLPRGVGKQLIATIAHPLNQAVFDPIRNVVIEGYGIIQPRVGVSLTSAQASRFAEVFSGHCGLDPYTQMVSDVYQDLFGEASYVGKGIYDLSTFEKAMQNRVPENSLLSHDLFEGCFARVALATDLEIFDNFPSNYHSFAKRLHRWVRGDWQLLPWIFFAISDRQNNKLNISMSMLGRWKIIDNLRRSLVAPAIFSLFLLSFTILPGSTVTWIAMILIVLAFPVYARMANALIISPVNVSVSGYAKGLGQDLLKQSLQVILTLSFLPSQAYLMVHAIVISIYRMYFSKSKLLEWQSSQESEDSSSSDITKLFKSLGAGLFLTFLVTVLVAIYSPERIFYALPFLLLWATSPLIIHWLNQSPNALESKVLKEDREYLEVLGSEIWGYFDQLLNAKNNYLIPDNLQLLPKRIVAERTSPTNISLSILSVISAFDLGYITLSALISHLTKIYETLEKLERFHGHFLNWYETSSLLALAPRYISFVDSGNLVGHLIAARSAFIQLPHASLVSEYQLQNLCRKVSQLLELEPSFNIRFRENLLKLKSKLTNPGSNIKELSDLLDSVHLFLDQTEESDEQLTLEQNVKTKIENFKFILQEFLLIKPLVSWYSIFERNYDLFKTSLDKNLMDQLEELQLSFLEEGLSLISMENMLSSAESLILTLDIVGNQSDINLNSKNQSSIISDVLAEVRLAIKENEAYQKSLTKLSAQTETIIETVDLGFLYDSAKGLFSIGYHVESAQRDKSFYDLLASESRLGSFVAIVTGKVPQKHWFALGRSLVRTNSGAALVSWSATMFEYLMPLLVMKDYRGTLLSKTYRAVLTSQRRYAKKHGLPWGMSESAYSGVDFEKTYQYKAFGVPALGLKRGLADDLVISPYSTLLAVTIDPAHSIQNLKILDQEGMRGEFGFYEALDFTKERLRIDEKSHIVSSFFAHHQGMSLIAINNLLRSGIMQERFHSDSRVKSGELLLQERFPSTPVAISKSNLNDFSEHEGLDLNITKGEQFFTPHTRYPRTQMLSNGHYSIMIDNAGNGCSSFDRDLAITRWREDGIAGQSGTYIFIKDLDSGKLWSVAYQPTKVEPDTYEVLFNSDKIEFKRRDFGIFVHTEITVSPEDNVELRKVTLSNFSNRTRNIELISYAEVALANYKSDRAHPAFSKMFIESEYHPDLQALVFSRRQRFHTEERLYLIHLLNSKTVWAPTKFESSRFKFLGRGQNIASAKILQNYQGLKGTVGAVLDPIFSLAAKVTLTEGQTESLTFVTGFAKSFEEIQAIGERYRDLQSVNRAFEMSWSHSNIEIRQEQFSMRQSQVFERLATTIFYNIDSLRGSMTALHNKNLSQSALWRFDVSGDLPIILLRIDDPSQIKLVHEMLLAHRYIRMRGLSFDLVIVNEYPTGYLQEFQNELEFTARSSYFGGLVDKKGGIYLRSKAQISVDEIGLLESLARIVIWGSKGTLASQMHFSATTERGSAPRRRTPLLVNKKGDQLEKNLKVEKYEFFNGLGGFIDQGSKYQLEIENNQLPPLPWSNLIANQNFGFLVTESGAGYTWSENSRENKLTPWSNDPVSDYSGEVIYIRDLATGNFWNPTPRPIQSESKFQIQHGFGKSQFNLIENGLKSELALSGSINEKVKWWKLSLKNLTNINRNLEVFLYIEWVLGVNREDSVRNLIVDFDRQNEFLHVTNNYNNEFAGRVVSIGSNLKISSYTASRADFIGRHRDLSSPQAFDKTPMGIFSNISSVVELSKKLGSGLDSCGVIKVELSVAAGQEKEVLFYLNETSSIVEARRDSARHRLLSTRFRELKMVEEHWEENLTTIQVQTPDRDFDILMNGWLLYQTIACRIYARSAFYQSGGAIGFRDQLQDVLALLYSRIDLAREQILIHAAHQFIEGDVQHWWHPPSGRGVRTLISDDYLWLPYVVARYLEVSNDFSILSELIPFVESPLLKEHQMESYTLPHVSQRQASLYEHCTLALDRSLNFGVHGLPLIAGGDWNDGMNEVGKEGKGESIWLAWFLSHTLSIFSKYTEQQNDNHRTNLYQLNAKKLISAIEQHGWDGLWYKRAYFDDGTSLGSQSNDQCKIDSIAQSWSVITGGGDSERRTTAMNSLRTELVNHTDHLIYLLKPPFDISSLEPGYIKGYPPGLRENGGQYTHAAAWAIIATAKEGKGNEAYKMFSMINPINLTLSKAGVEKYQAEPYVLAADVYSNKSHMGRAGWTWYTGSSGWLYQAGIEYILGLKVVGDYFTVDPVIPSRWLNFSFNYHYKNINFQVQIKNPEAIESGVKKVFVEHVHILDKKIIFHKYLDLAPKVVNILVEMGSNS